MTITRDGRKKWTSIALSLILILTQFAFAVPAGAVAPPTFAYIANNDGTVSKINISTNTVVETIPVGSAPKGVGITPDGRKVYVTNFSDGTVSVVDSASNTVSTTIDLITGSNPGPYAVACNPVSPWAYVPSCYSDSVFVINTVDDTVYASVNTGAGASPRGVAVSPDGTKIYVTNYSNNNVSVIDAATNTVSKTINVGTSPYDVCFSPDGTKAYVTNRDNSPGIVSVINTATDEVISSIATVGDYPLGVTVSPDGSYVYVANGANPPSVSVIDADTNTVFDTIYMPDPADSPCGISIDPTGASIYVTNTKGEVNGSVFVIDAASRTITVNSIAVGYVPESRGQFIGTLPLLPGHLQFGAPTYPVAENDGFAEVTVTRTGGSDGVVSAVYSTGDGTATAGLDYITTVGTVYFADGDANPKIFTVPVVTDALTEGSETVNLTLSNPSGGVEIGDQSTAVLTIQDFAPGAPTITFTDSDTDHVYFDGDSLGVSLSGLSIPDGQVRVALGVMGPNGFEPAKPVVNDMTYSGPYYYVLDTITGGTLNISETVYNPDNTTLPTGTLAVKLYSEDGSTDYTASTGPMAFQNAAGKMAIVSIYIPLADVTSTPDLSEFNDLYETEQAITFTRSEYGSIEFNPGLNFMEDTNDLAALDINIVSGENSQYYVEVNAETATFLAEKGASVTMLNVPFQAVNISSSSYTGVASDVYLDVGAKTLTFDVNHFSRYTVTQRQTEGSSGSSSSNTNPVTPVATKPADNKVSLPTDATRTSLGTDNNRSTATVTLNSSTVINTISQSAVGSIVVIPVNAAANVVKAEIPGDIVTALVNKDASMEIEASNGSYTLPGQEINIANIAQQLGVPARDVTLNIVIAQATAGQTATIQRYASQNGLTQLVTPVDFKVEGTAAGKTIEINGFNSYVNRSIILPSPVNANLAVGAVLNADGTLSPVPTQFTVENGKNVAVIKRKTNSTYTVVQHSKSFADVSTHWAKDDINSLASKMIITGITNSTYAPENKITRAQFATLIVRALGIESNASKAVFSDVKAGDWFAGAVGAAVDAGVIKGYTDGTFKPNAFVTREEVAAMVVQALKVAGQDTSVTAEETGQYIAQFKDGAKIDSWARTVVAAAAKNGIIKGNTNGAFTPAGNSTRAESAVMIKNMLAKAKFI